MVKKKLKEEVEKKQKQILKKIEETECQDKKKALLREFIDSKFIALRE